MNKSKKIAAMLALTLSVSMFSGCGILEKFGIGGGQEGNVEGTESLQDTENLENTEKIEDTEDWIPDLGMKEGTEEGEEKEECNCVNLCSSTSISDSCQICIQDYHQCVGASTEDPLDAFALPDGKTATVSIAAYGSNFYDTAIMNGTDKSYKYEYIYEGIKNAIQNYDVKITTQETVFANDPSKYSGQNPYKSPPSVASALSSSGFNVVASATDHSFDNGITGVVETINAWKQYEGSVFTPGICASKEDYDNICMTDTNGIRIAFLSYTSSLNGMTLTNEEKTYVKTLYDEDSVAEEIQYASKNADFVIVMPHWGTEDAKTHSANQETWAQIFADNGADLIIGTGSDTIQDVALIQREDGQSVPCYYSLGNLVAPVQKQEQVLSGMADITITKTGKVTTIESYNMSPVVLHVSKKGDYFKPYLIGEYTEDTAKWHNLKAKKKPFSIQELQTLYDSTVQIQDIKAQSSGSGSTMTPVQARKPSNVDTEAENDGNPLVDNSEDVENENNESADNPISPSVVDEDPFSGIEAIGN